MAEVSDLRRSRVEAAHAALKKKKTKQKHKHRNLNNTQNMFQNNLHDPNIRAKNRDSANNVQQNDIIHENDYIVAIPKASYGY